MTEDIPWADGRSRFTKGFNNEVSYLSLSTAKTIIARLFNIDWRTVGNIIKATHDRLEPDIKERLKDLRKICVDETSYRIGHSYITVVYDMERNKVVWLHPGHGQKVFEKFLSELDERERDMIEVVAADGARWVDKCISKYLRNAQRCLDPWHIINCALVNRK